MEFTSFRKWMSIVVTDHENGKIKLYMKGADSEVLKRLSKTNSDEMIEEVKDYIKEASESGFWVLLLAYKFLSPEELLWLED